MRQYSGSLTSHTDITEVVIILNTDQAVKAFSRGGNVTLGGGISVSAGPIGTGGQIAASLANPAPMYSYSRSKGLFAGLALDGTILVERKDANRDFYGSSVSATDILTRVIACFFYSFPVPGSCRQR